MLQETQKKTVIENENLQASTSSSKKPTFQNPLLSNDDTSEDEDEDAMPKPIIVKQEPCDMVVTHKKLSLKERFNIDCEECEKVFNFFYINSFPFCLNNFSISIFSFCVSYHPL